MIPSLTVDKPEILYLEKKEDIVLGTVKRWNAAFDAC